VTLLGADLVSAFVALFGVDSVFGFSLTETALTGLPVLIGLFYMSGLYSGDTLPPGEGLRARLLGTLAFVAMFFVVSGEYLDPNIWLAAACQGVFIFLLGYYVEALTRHALIRRKLWGGGHGLCRQRRSRRASPQLAFRRRG
jgi:hypothetical protein